MDCQKDFIDSAERIISPKKIQHYDLHKKQEMVTEDFLLRKEPLKILITSGASCPDALVEEVINKLASFFPVITTGKELLAGFE